MKFSKIVFTGLATAVSLLAGDPSGRWTAEFTGPQGNTIHNVIVLKAQGEKLTGTVEGMRGGETTISDGKVEGDNVSFVVVRRWQGVQFKMIYNGTMKREVIHFTVTREGGQGGSREFDARRSS
jgi:hypothetical protein